MWSIISELMFWLMLLCIIAIPVLLITFVILWATKKRKLWVGLSALFCFIGIFIFAIIFGIANYKGMTPEERLEMESTTESAIDSQKEEAEKEQEDKEPNKEEPKKEPADKEPPKESIPEKVEPENNSSTIQKVDDMIAQFMDLGFTESEAEKMKEIFTTVGITEISNIQYALGNGIDKLQSFKCDIFDYHADKGGISLHFTVDNRQLCFISLDGIPTTKTDYAYINIWGNVKFKTSNSLMSVTLYDVWDENGEIIPDAVGYKAVFDYKENKITEYK